MARLRSNPAYVASQRRAWVFAIALIGAMIATASWLTASPGGLPAFVAPAMSTLDRAMAALVAAGTGLYALAFASGAVQAIRARRWGAFGWGLAAACVQGLLAVMALSFAFPQQA